jgi:hypothetical protein
MLSTDHNADVGEKLLQHTRDIFVHAVKGFLTAIRQPGKNSNDGELPDCLDLEKTATEPILVNNNNDNETVREEKSSNDRGDVIAAEEEASVAYEDFGKAARKADEVIEKEINSNGTVDKDDVEVLLVGDENEKVK